MWKITGMLWFTFLSGKLLGQWTTDTEPKFTLLAVWQAEKFKDELLGQGIMTNQKASRLRRWQTSASKNCPASVRIQAPFILRKGRGSSHRSLTNNHLFGGGLSAMLTSGWAGPLMVTRLQLPTVNVHSTILWGRGRWWAVGWSWDGTDQSWARNINTIRFIYNHLNLMKFLLQGNSNHNGFSFLKSHLTSSKGSQPYCSPGLSEVGSFSDVSGATLTWVWWTRDFIPTNLTDECMVSNSTCGPVHLAVSWCLGPSSLQVLKTRSPGQRGCKPTSVRQADLLEANSCT